MGPIYDILIIGCGMSGAIAALTALKKGLSVCIVEQRVRHLIGKKCCGELMPQETLFWLEKEFNMTIPFYPLQRLQICTLEEHARCPYSLAGIIINQPLCTIDRYTVQQNMVAGLLKRGAVLHHGTVVAPVGTTRIEGVKTKESHTLKGKVVIDCSGTSSVLSSHVAFAGLLPPRAVGIAYKETLTLREPMESKVASIIMDLNVGFSQYMWCFPKSPHHLNAGIGGLSTSRSDLLQKFKTVLHAHPFKISSRKDRGFGTLPLSGPAPCAVGPGLLLCGDAAGHVNPLTGEGIDPAIRAGYCAGTVAARAIRKDDLSVKALWPYNCEIARKPGIVHMSFLLLREFLRSLRPEHIQFLLSTILSGDTLEQLETNTLSGMQKFYIALRGLKKPDLLFRLFFFSKTMEKLRLLYDRYPAHANGFPNWLMTFQSIVHTYEHTRLFPFN